MRPTDKLTVLRHASIPQSKTWQTDGGIQAHGKAKHFEVDEVEVNGVRELSDALSCLESDPFAAVVRGEFVGESRGGALRRKENFRDVPRNWLMIDVDGHETERDAMVDPVGAVREWIEEHLPTVFHGVSVRWQLSASFGHPSKQGLRVHLWVWSKTPYLSADLRRWAKASGFAGDPTLFDTIQLHYTAAPIFERGVVDPVLKRSGFLEGEFGDVVHLDIPANLLEGSKGEQLTREKKRQEAWTNDQMAQWLIASEFFKSYRNDGGLNIACLLADQHSSESGESSTIYYPAHTNGYVHGSFVCLHSHGTDDGFNRQCFEKVRELGFDDAGTVFTSLDNTVNLLRADQIIPEPIEWLWAGWLARGKLVLKAGSPGTGKTTLAMAIAATVTDGGKWPDGSNCERGSVLIWSGEDDPRDTLVPRLLAHGADLSRVHFVGDAIGPDGPRPFDPARDTPLLLFQAERLGDVRLIVVDPIVSAVAGDSHKNAEVRRGLQPLVDLASRIGACLIGITHFTKGTGGRDTTERVTGSLAFAALARIVLATAKDQAAGDHLLTRSKSNVGPDGGGFRYHLEQVDIAAYPGLTASRVVWGEHLEGNARELIAEAEGDQASAASAEDAANWLRGILSLGPMLAADIYTHGEAKGYGERRLQRALKKIGGVSEKTGFRAPAMWKLPGYEFVDGDTLTDENDEL